MNTGEGGLSPYHLEGGADIVFQIGTAKYGVRGNDGKLDEKRLQKLAALESVRMFELKLSQGAKPGKGGILPGAKVTEEIARIRGIPAGRDSISPNRHPEINNANELIDNYCRIRDLTGKPVGFKAVIGAYGWLASLFDEIARRPEEDAPDFITIDSADGGTGAAPMSLMDYINASRLLPVESSSHQPKSPGHYAPAPTSRHQRVVSCLRWVAFRRCNAIATPAQPASRRTTNVCSAGLIRSTRRSECVTMRRRCITNSA